jgi:hypothetical protein
MPPDQDVKELKLAESASDNNPPASRLKRFGRALVRPRLTPTNAILLVVIALLVGHAWFSDPYANVYRLQQSSLSDHEFTWTTLGTNSGPIARSECRPAVPGAWPGRAGRRPA